MVLVLFCKVRGMLKVAGLSAHSDRRVEIERQLGLGMGVWWGGGGGPCGRLELDETVESREILELGVRVEQEGRVVCVCHAHGMEFLQVRHEVVDALRVQKLAGDG